MKKFPALRYVALGLILLVALYFIYFKPKNAQLRTLRGERVKAQQEVENLRLKKRQLDKIEGEIGTLDATLKELEMIIPQKREISEILTKIQDLAYDSQLNITKFVPRGEVNKDFYLEWPIPIEITGNYNNLGVFFDRLSNFSRIFIIESFSIKTLPRQTDTSTISANFTAKTYYFPEEAPSSEGAARPKK
jgi:Tfp pilus assembly protein PilO